MKLVHKVSKRMNRKWDIKSVIIEKNDTENTSILSTLLWIH